MKNFVNKEDVKFGTPRKVDIPAEIAGNSPWFNQTLTEVNESCG